MIKVLIFLVSLFAVNACGQCKRHVPKAPVEKTCVKCPECSPAKNCPTCPECPGPLPPAVVKEFDVSLNEFTVVLVMTDQNTMGLLVYDNTNKYALSVFSLPELNTTGEFDDILQLMKPDGTNIQVGSLDDEDTDQSVSLVYLCQNEFMPNCTASVLVKNVTPTMLNIVLADQTSFTWTAVGPKQ